MQTKDKMKTRGKIQNEDCRLHTTGKMKEKSAGNTSAFVEVRRNVLSLKSTISLLNNRVLMSKDVEGSNFQENLSHISIGVRAPSAVGAVDLLARKNYTMPDA